MLHMEEVRRVMRPAVMFHIRQQSWGLVAGRLNDPTVEPRQSLFHEFLPGVRTAGPPPLLQQNIVAPGLEPHQAYPPRKGFILRQRDVLRWHRTRQPRTLLAAGPHDLLFKATGCPGLGAVGS